MIDKDFIKKYGLQVRGYEKIRGVVKITTPKASYIVKKRCNNSCYSYLRSRNFPYIPQIYNTYNDDNYDLVEYIPSIEVSSSEKIKDLIEMVSLLHTKTTSYRKISLDDVKIIYDDIKKELSNSKAFYEDYFSIVRSEIFMSPDHYLFARNSSKLKSLFLFCDEALEDWYEMMKNEKKQRVCFVHHNLSLEHFLENENRYLISWGKANWDIPIYDLVDLYRKYYKLFDFGELLLLYENRYPFLNSERSLFFLLISIPKIIYISDNTYLNTIEVKKFFEYIEKTDELLSPYYANKQKKEK